MCQRPIPDGESGFRSSKFSVCRALSSEYLHMLASDIVALTGASWLMVDWPGDACSSVLYVQGRDPGLAPPDTPPFMQPQLYGKRAFVTFVTFECSLDVCCTWSIGDDGQRSRCHRLLLTVFRPLCSPWHFSARSNSKQELCCAFHLGQIPRPATAFVPACLFPKTAASCPAP